MSKQSRRLLRLVPRLRRQRDERGAYAILFSMMLILVMALAAIAVDVASQVSSKQQLKDTMDAAAHAGAFAIDEGIDKAKAEIARVARANDPTANPTVDTWCVVGSTGEDERVNKLHIPSTCDPGKGPEYTAARYPGLVCDEEMCFIPCDAKLPTAKCNTIRVADEKVVPYAFAPAIGFDEGSTGAVVSIACKGTCGREAYKPMNVVIMADRTVSMEPTDVTQMVSGIRSSLQIMSPDLQYVAFGAIHKSAPRAFTKTGSVCATAPAGVKQGRYLSDNKKTKTHGTSSVSYGETVYVPKTTSSQRTHYFSNATAADLWDGNTPRIVKEDGDATQGKWVAVDFSNSYLHPQVAGEPGVVKASDPLVKGLDCLVRAEAQANNGTHLAAAMKGAARYLLNSSENNLSSLPVREVETVQDVIIFETDGEPSESALDPEHRLPTSYKGLTSAGDFGATSTQGGCDNLLSIANEAKKKKILIITIGYGKANTAECSSKKPVRDTLAEASGREGMSKATASDCSKPAQRVVENSDDDFFFCAAGGAELQETFRTAFTKLSNSVRLLKMPKS